ncbi:hypothetical protein PVAP13_4KG370600 [Panicum virgatum]|uniref:Uncharacterized protein n=1 Tax=Panicum virgatum TaxID=38727 RepID=A0A8T0TV12_PANVG|nr:hypothetical protein PVAP13_4KG370600 [Panicum virgatum]
MARGVLAAALVLCAAVAVAHGARVLEDQQPDGAGFGEGPAPAQGLELDPPPAVPGGGGRVRVGGISAIADILWFVLRWANEAGPAAGDRRKDY